MILPLELAAIGCGICNLQRATARVTFLLAKLKYFRLQAGADGSPQVGSFFLAIQVWVLGQHVLGDSLPRGTFGIANLGDSVQNHLKIGRARRPSLLRSVSKLC